MFYAKVNRGGADDAVAFVTKSERDDFVKRCADLEAARPINRGEALEIAPPRSGGELHEFLIVESISPDGMASYSEMWL